MTLINADSRNAINSMQGEDVGLIYDPPWDQYQDFPIDVRNYGGVLAFADSGRFGELVTMLGAPTWVFVWDCVTSWYTPNRPLRRSKYCLWYGDIKKYSPHGYKDQGRNRKPVKKTVKNTRGTYKYVSFGDGAFLSDVYTSPITQLHAGGSSHSKPIEWVTMLVGNCLGACSIIFDPFAGTGVFGVAARRVDTPYLGVEIDRDEYLAAIATDDIAKPRSPGSLFDWASEQTIKEVRLE